MLCTLPPVGGWHNHENHDDDDHDDDRRHHVPASEPVHGGSGYLELK